MVKSSDLLLRKLLSCSEVVPLLLSNLLQVGSYYLIYRLKKLNLHSFKSRLQKAAKIMSSTTGEADIPPSLTSTQPCFRLSLAEIQSATKNFDDELVIGQGGFGKVYQGCIFIEETSHDVAIKRLDSLSNQGAPEFRTEIEMLSRLRHCHLVSLIGYCEDNKEMILVYAYMPHGTLYHHLHKAETPLNWVQRLKIALGAGRGLDYLHTGVGTQHGVIHRDVKTSNILLDEKWEAMISDFGMSKISQINPSSSYANASVKGTFGYLDPEYFYTCKLTRKTDVYAFGVVLFELLSGRFAVDERNGEDEYSLAVWAKKCVKARKLDQMVDSNIRGTIFPKCLKGFAEIAYRCLLRVPKERPTMAEVVVSLQALLELQQRHDNSAEPSSITRFPWKIAKYLAPGTKQNSDQSRKHPTGSGSDSVPVQPFGQKAYPYMRGRHPSPLHEVLVVNNMRGSDQGEKPPQHEILVVSDLKRFTYDELILATKNFGNDTCLSVNRYEKKVYKGWIDETTYSPCGDNIGLPIVIKEIDILSLVDRLVLKMLKECSHPNLLKHMGYCHQINKHLLIVYEFMPNGNFEDLLHSGGVSRLQLVTKVKIAVGIARGITFLHKTQDEVSESRLDRHNILLDEDFTAKLSGYDVNVTKLEHDSYPLTIPLPKRHFIADDSAPWAKTSQLQTNLSGFTVVFVELLTGEQISDEVEIQKIDGLFLRHGKPSLVDIANLCFNICNEVDSESRILEILEDYMSIPVHSTN